MQALHAGMNVRTVQYTAALNVWKAFYPQKAQQVSTYNWFVFVLVQLGELVHREMPLDLLFVDDSGGKRLLCHLKMINEKVVKLTTNKMKTYLQFSIYIFSFSVCSWRLYSLVKL